MPRPLGGHVFPPTGTIFNLIQDIIGKNRLTKLHDDRTINVASRVLIRKNAPPHGVHLHEDRKKNVAYRVLTRFYIRKNAPPPGGHVFQPTGIIIKRVQDIIGRNLLTMFHEYRTINVASRVLTRFYYSYIKKYAPPLGSHVFQANINVLTKFHEDWTINVASRVLKRKNSLPPQDRKINVASRVLTRKNAPPLVAMKNAPPLGSHVFQANVTIFELIQDIIEINVLTKFHEDWTINVASRVLIRQMLMPHDEQPTTDKR
ncbi:hypothetical protein DPMN_150680 [Dreissena polymorpha]|uniref:Uncharacterized protein n=1 Tax=Dreissena polymorpha TaxID=45954 RepID=A0A9D4J3K0_DREPO|nr:hypothetical protein DPMN_150680 [Dreissena polymorpha]